MFVLYIESLYNTMLSKDELLNKMEKIKNNRNYNNILLFPTLEGFTDKHIPEEILKNEKIKNFLQPGRQEILIMDDSNTKYYDPNNPNQSKGSNATGSSNSKGSSNATGSSNSNGSSSGKKTKTLTKEQSAKLDNLSSFIGVEIEDLDAEFLLDDTLDKLDNVLSDLNLPDEIPEDLEDVTEMLKPESFAVFLAGMSNFLMFFISLFNNILIYFSVVIAQLSYGNLPITPFDNMGAPITKPNWPWKLDLNVDPSDNVVINPKTAKLIDPNGPPLLIGNTYVPASVYAENQQILYDSSIIYSIFTQIILVIVTWIFTNNAYFYIYYDSTSLPLRVISPENITEEGVVEVKKGSLIFYTLLNTFIASPFDILIYIFKAIKWFAKLIYLYNFPSLLYILLFMLILLFNLTSFWDLYNSFINNPFAWVQDKFFLSFMLYGVIRHYLLVATITSINMGPTITNFITWCLYNLFIILAIGGILYAVYPVMRIAFYFWFIYVFFGFYGFSNNAYDDIMKHENKKCESNVFKIGTFIRDAIVYFYSYFFYFVMFVLIISNFIYLAENPMQNSNSSSAVKLVLSVLFLFAFMYLVYFILNKKSYKSNTNVAYGDSYKDNSQELENKLKNIPMNIAPIDVVEKKEKVSPTPTPTTTPITIKKNSFFERLLEDIKIVNEKIGGDSIVEKFETKIKEVNDICNEVADIFKSPISIQSVTGEVELKLKAYNGLNRKQMENVLALFKEMILMKIDANVSKFCNRAIAIIKGINDNEVKNIIENAKKAEEKKKVGEEKKGGEGEEKTEEEKENIIDTLKNTTFMKEIQTAYDEDIVVIQNKLADMLNRIFNTEIQMAISITQIYNSGFAIAFIQAQPEIGFFCFVISQLYPNATKASLINTIGSVASIGYNSIKSKFGNLFRSKAKPEGEGEGQPEEKPIAVEAI